MADLIKDDMQLFELMKSVSQNLQDETNVVYQGFYMHGKLNFELKNVAIKAKALALAETAAAIPPNTQTALLEVLAATSTAWGTMLSYPRVLYALLQAPSGTTIKKMVDDYDKLICLSEKHAVILTRVLDIDSDQTKYDEIAFGTEFTNVADHEELVKKAITVFEAALVVDDSTSIPVKPKITIRDTEFVSVKTLDQLFFTVNKMAITRKLGTKTDLDLFARIKSSGLFDMGNISKNSFINAALQMGISVVTVPALDPTDGTFNVPVFTGALNSKRVQDFAALLKSKDVASRISAPLIDIDLVRRVCGENSSNELVEDFRLLMSTESDNEEKIMGLNSDSYSEIDSHGELSDD
jgi:hypothetical protein